MSETAEPLLTLADLEHWSFAGTALAVVGRPVAHSLSPEMHNAALAQLAKAQPTFRDWRYFKFDIAPADLPRALQLFHAKKFRGLNLTVPHKILAVEFLTASDPGVRAAGAANTLSYSVAGWQGANTDGYGLAAALREQLQVKLAGRHVVLLGAGGAARAAAVECLQNNCASLWIGNRTAATLEDLCTHLQTVRSDTIPRGFDLRLPPADLPSGCLVINATSLGLAAADAAPLDLTTIPRPAAVFDMIYRPPLTALLQQAVALGIARANGLAMLIHQGARSLEIWTGQPAPVAIMQAAAHRALGAN